MLHKKGVSGVVATVVLVALVMVSVAVVWGVVSNIINERTSNVEACFGNFDKVELNGRYTCYDSGDAEMRFSINIGNIAGVEKTLVYVQGEGNTFSFEMNTTPSAYADIRNYPAGAYNTANVQLPGKNSGKTYILNTASTLGSGVVPDSIKIIPVINGEECQVSDQISEIVDCSILA